jgi:hypothetical protein
MIEAIWPEDQDQHIHIRNVVRLAASSQNATVRSALTALEVAVSVDQSAALAEATLFEQRWRSTLGALGVLSGRGARLRQQAIRLVDRTIETRDGAALNALDDFIRIAGQNDA